MPFIYIPVVNDRYDSPSAFLEALAIGIIDIIKHEAFTNHGKSPTLERIATDNPKIYQPSIHDKCHIPATELHLIDYQLLLEKIITYQFPVGKIDPVILAQLKIYNPLKIVKHLLLEFLFQQRYIAPLDLVRDKIKKFQPAQSDESKSKLALTFYNRKEPLPTDELKQQENPYLSFKKTSALYRAYMACVWLLILTNQSPHIPLNGIEIDLQLLKAVYSVMGSLQLKEKMQDLSKPSKILKDQAASDKPPLSDQDAVDFIIQEESFLKDVFFKDIFGVNYLKDSLSPIQTKDSVILSALRSKPFDRFDGYFITEKLQINLRITTDPSDIMGEKLESTKPTITLYPPTNGHSKHWQTVLMTATGTRREDLCFKHFKDSVLTVAEIKEVIHSFKYHTGYQFFSSSSKPLQDVIKNLREQITPKLEGKETNQTVPELMGIITTSLNEQVFKEKHLKRECTDVKEALEYLILRFTYMNGYTVHENSPSTETPKSACKSLA